MILLRPASTKALGLLTFLWLTFLWLAFFLPPTAKAEEASREQKVAALIMMGFNGKTPEDAGSQAMASAIQQRKVGGVLTLGHNFGGDQSPKALAHFLQSASPDGLPVLIGIDQEGGRIQRLAGPQGWKAMPSAEAVAQTMSPAEAEALYSRVACTLRQWGFTYNLGPVVDLAREPKNRVIVGLKRSFGNNPERVADYAGAAVRAHRNCGVLTALKHFPGHGSSLGDSHKGFTDVTDHWTPEEMDPYHILIRRGLVDSVMTAHISHQKVDPDYPASLSPEFIGQVLRQTLGFQGLVISDDMTMGAIADHYGVVEASVQALLAGGDVILIATALDQAPDLPSQIVSAVLTAVQVGTLDWSRIEDAYARVQAARHSIAR